MTERDVMQCPHLFQLRHPFAPVGPQMIGSTRHHDLDLQQRCHQRVKGRGSIGRRGQDQIGKGGDGRFPDIGEQDHDGTARLGAFGKAHHVALVAAMSVVRAFARYRGALVGADLSDDVAAIAALEMSAHGLPDDPTVLSYLVSAAIITDLPQRQALLETPDTSSRLRAELALLSREITIVRALGAVPAVELFHQPIYPN